MSVYTVRVVQMNGTVVRTLGSCNVLSVVDELNGPGEATFSYPKYDPVGLTGQAADVHLLDREIQVLRDGVVIHWGVPIRRQASGGTGDRVVTAPGLAWWFGRRRIDGPTAGVLSALIVTDPAEDITTLAGRIVTFAQDATAGKSALGITVNTPASGVTIPFPKEWRYDEHAQVDRVIADELAPLGFDWQVDTGRVFRTYAPRRGVDRSATVTLQPGVNIASYELDEDGASTSTAVTVVGDQDGAVREESTAVNTADLSGIVLQDVVPAAPGTTVEMLAPQAADRLSRARRLVRLPSVTTYPGAVDLIGLLDPGDVVTVTINDGDVQLSGPYRIVRIQLDPRTDTLQLTLNDDGSAVRGAVQPPTLARVVTNQDVRLSNVERRRRGVAAPIFNKDIAPAAAIAVAKVDGLPALLVAAKDRPNHTGAQAIATVTGLQPALDAKADLAGATFTGGVSVQGATTDAAAGVRRAAIGGGPSQTPRLILENPDFGGTRWALINTNSELQAWEFTSGTSKMTLNTLGDLSLAGNLPARGPTVRGGITQNELDGKRDVIHIVGFRHAPVNQTITNGVQTAVSFGNSSSVGNIGFGVSGGDVKVQQAGHYGIGTAINFGITDGAGGSTVAGARDVYLQVLRAGAVLYEGFRSAYAGAGFRASVEVSMSEHLQVNDLVRVLVTVSGSNVQMEARLLPSGKPTTMSLEVAYDHAD